MPRSPGCRIFPEDNGLTQPCDARGRLSTDRSSEVRLLATTWRCPPAAPRGWAQRLSAQNHRSLRQRQVGASRLGNVTHDRLDPEVHSRLREPGGVLGDQSNKTTIARLSPVGWDTVARICARGVTDCLKPTSRKAIADIKIVEVNWRGHHNCLTLFQDHAGKKIPQGAPREDTVSLDTIPNSATNVPVRSPQ